MERFESVEEFASLDPNDWPRLAIEACRLAVTTSGVDEESVRDALRAVEEGDTDDAISASMRNLADQLDEAAWDAHEGGHEARYDFLFCQSRAVSALDFALSQQPDEAIYEAAHAIGMPHELVRRLAS